MRPLFIRMVAEAVETIALVSQEVESAKKISDKDAEAWVAMLGGARSTFEGMGLDLSVAQIDRIERDVLYLQDPRPEDISGLLRELVNRYNDELKKSHCFMLTSERARFWETKQLFGSEVWERFPSANSDIEEAGKCLACNRGTATVFHLMRVMEAGLKATAAALEIPYAPSWESYPYPDTEPA